MRLNQIKLSGFKSFAEPTTFQLPGQRVGVVGPNGCGKSNIMDAVRWVLGESKASELRGESMQDVIFNGSGQRRPASRASVELVFDNASARAGGQWNAFAEIAVRRVLTRDGGSSYYINNQPVRRRDVQDVFLGTGLGPRAYAIIGQGTISRIIESRPEELRLFLEEAAGVSKYKERRRETENRLKDTRENLTRVDDILRELNATLAKLERQAEVATRYRALQGEGTLKLHQLWWLKAQDAAGERARVQAESEAAALALEGRVAELRRVEAELEQLRQAHYAASDALHERQGALSDAALEVSRLEERIRYVVDGRQRAQARLAELHAQDAAWGQRQADAAREANDVAARIGAADEDCAVLEAQSEEAAAELPQHDDALRAAQAAASRERAAAQQVQQQLQLLAAEGRNVDEQARALRVRRDRLAVERQQLAAPDAARLQAVRDEEAAAQALHAQAEAALQALQQHAESTDAQRRAAQDAVNRESAALADTAARLQALRALQDKVRTSGTLEPWLARHGLAGLPGLWQQVHVEPGWETALEAALRERLAALAVGRLDSVRGFDADAPPAKLAFYAPPGAPGSTAPPGQSVPSAQSAQSVHSVLSGPDTAAPAGAGLPRLSTRLRLPDAALQALLTDWLRGVHAADSLDAALAARGALQPGECIVTRAGHLLQPNSVLFYAPDSEQAGLLARAHEIENLDRQHRAQALIEGEARAQSVRLEAAWTDASQRLVAARRDVGQAQSRAHALHVELLRLSQQQQATQQRGAQLDEELAELDAQLESLQERRETAQARFEELDVQLGDAQQRQADAEDAVLAAERRVAERREQQRSLERRAQEARFQARALVARRDELQRALQTAAQQRQANQEAAQTLAQELAGFDDAAAQSGLQQALALRLEREQALGAARSRYDDLSAQLRRSDEQRLSLERGLEPLRERIGQLQLQEQAAQLGAAQFLEQLAAAEVDTAALAGRIVAEGVKLWGLQTEIDRIQKEIAALGAVNLAALDELTASRERKTFLDAQLADLTEAITTLEDAIRTIDLETRGLLSSTFAQVNGHFGRMFPSLFGGGNARLVMTGDEILDAGVQVMAQPPGKKNSTIHLLSGGEKALTAIALVFAIFLLNPAPFCLLDEVDAPLDDANTERYRRLVTEMSLKGTQFLFISHNKIAMEMAEQLIGVTMQEQGVSRIVAVDMASAAGLAEAA